MNPNSKERDDESDDRGDGSKTSEATPSLLQRLGTSASALMQDSLARPQANDVAGVLAALGPEASKQSSNISPGSFGESSSSVPSHYSPENQLRGGSMRSGVAGPAQNAYDQFTAGPPQAHHVHDNSYSPTFWGSEPLSTLSGRDKSHQSHTLDSYPYYWNTSAYADIDENAVHFPGHDVDVDPNGSARQDYKKTGSHDGAAVVALLSDPTFSVDYDPIGLLAPSAGGVANVTTAEANRNNKPKHLDADISPLHLIPHYGRSSAPAAPFSKKNDSFRGDLSPWWDILDRYHDEVWGEMLPLVQEAREEIRAATTAEDSSLQDRPAIRRLGMLLSHLEIPIL